MEQVCPQSEDAVQWAGGAGGQKAVTTVCDSKDQDLGQEGNGEIDPQRMELSAVEKGDVKTDEMGWVKDERFRHVVEQEIHNVEIKKRSL